MKVTAYSIGRASSNDIRLDHETVSGQHAELIFTRSGKLYVMDRGSTNRTWVMRDGSWTELEQGYVTVDQQVAFGESTHEVRDLVGLAGGQMD